MTNNLTRGTISTKAEEQARGIFARKEHKRDEFCRKLEKTVPKLKKEIADKGEISIPFENLGRELGIESIIAIRRRNPVGIYWDAKYCLLKENIHVTVHRKDREKMAIIRTMKPGDIEPQPLMTKEEAIRRLALELQRTGRVI